MNFEFYAELTARMEMTDDEFNYIYEAFKRHYDTTIQMASAHGGWLYGLKIRRTPWPGATDADVDKWIEVKDRQLQLMVKSLELHHTKEAFELTTKLCNLHALLRTRSNYINSIINNKGTSPTVPRIQAGTMMKCESTHEQCKNLTVGKSYRVNRIDQERESFTIIDDNGMKKHYKFNNSQFIIEKQ